MSNTSAFGYSVRNAVWSMSALQTGFVEQCNFVPRHAAPRLSQNTKLTHGPKSTALR